ncbi:MAG: HEAT repeat domain-containing protein [Acidobacteriota bacterium]|nr:HEAT repeat domain-containing protein [Acidobacteriota bacterium]
MAALFALGAFAADSDVKLRVRGVRDLAKAGSSAIPKIEPYLSDADVDVRIEAVKAIVDLDTQYSLDPLIKATSDNEPEIQIRATAGLVNFYLPGYVKTGRTAPLRRAGTAVKSRFTDTNDQVIDAFIQVRPEVIQALGRLVRGGAGMESRAHAARAVGILRGQAALPDLIAAARSKDTDVIYESLIALQKINDPSAGPAIEFLLRDLNEKVQLAAIETVGLLHDQTAVNALRDVLDRSKSGRIKHAALVSMAMLPDPELHPVYIGYLISKDDDLRDAAVEGLARLKNPADLPRIQQGWEDEKKTGPRLAMAFALVYLGKFDNTDFSPLRYIVNQLNSAGYRDTARAYLIELAHNQSVRTSLYPSLSQGLASKDEKTGLSQILATSGGPDSIPYLEELSKDPDKDVAQEGLRSLRTLRTRLP